MSKTYRRDSKNDKWRKEKQRRDDKKHNKSFATKDKSHFEQIPDWEGA